MRTLVLALIVATVLQAYAVPADNTPNFNKPEALSDDVHEYNALLLKASGDDVKDATRHMAKYDLDKDGKCTAQEIAEVLQKAIPFFAVKTHSAVSFRAWCRIITATRQ